MEIRLRFGRLRVVDDLTERARVRAIERLRNCPTQRSVFRVVDNHRCPGDGLERQPLQADCATQRENRNGATNTTKHAHEIKDAPLMGQSNKLKVAAHLNSRALRADAIESITCGYLSVVSMLGLAATWLLGWWWLDSVAALALIPFLIKEGRAAVRGECCC